MDWIRYRFRANEEDFRPVKWPPKGPYWCSGYGDGYSIVIAYLPKGEPLTDYWPEASAVDAEPKKAPEFSDRFPKPDWWSTSERL